MAEQTPSPDPPTWSTCPTEGCIGASIGGAEACLAHVEEPGRRAMLDALKPGADVDFRGTPIRAELLERILAPLRAGDSQAVTVQVVG